MHTMHCARNILLCPLCDEPVPRSEVEEHNEDFHTDKQCDTCKENVPPAEFDEHKVRERAEKCQEKNK